MSIVNSKKVHFFELTLCFKLKKVHPFQVDFHFKISNFKTRKALIIQLR